jgi:cellulose synthase/poly-beta-1,6-N-acetylglucosamine synthase-like glycosyltransferase
MPGLSNIILYVSLFVSLFFEVFILITYFETREELKFEEEHLKKEILHYPSVSIIVPSFNEETTVTATVESLLALDYPKDKLSLLLIDDGSTDHTLEVLNAFKGHPQVQIFTKPNEGSKFAALNFGLTKIDSDLVGCLDADSFVAPNALKLMIPFFDDEETMAVTPSIKIHDPKNILQYIQKMEYIWGVLFRRMLSSMGAMYVTPGPFSIFRVRVFTELGGYRQAHHTEDMELALRMQKNGYKIVDSVGAHVYTVAPDKLKDLYKQRVRWSYGFLNNAIDYRDMYFNRKYGHIGMFVLPIATLSVFNTLYAAANFVFGLSTQFVHTFIKYQTVGFSLHSPHINFSWFYWNTSMLLCVAVIAITINIVLLLLSANIAREEKFVGKELFYYIPLYIFLPPFWLAKSTYNTFLSKKITWR